MGYVKYAYSGCCVEARTHQSGWAARNANNHNQVTRQSQTADSAPGVATWEGQRTHGTTFRAFKVTPQLAIPGAESAVYDCLVSFAFYLIGLTVLLSVSNTDGECISLYTAWHSGNVIDQINKVTFT